MSDNKPRTSRTGPPTRLQNPGTLQSCEDIKTQFVVRNQELDTVLDVLQSNITAPASQHLLLLAPRGRGKTMLLVRAEAELLTAPKFSRHLLPVRLMQESYEIFDIGSFWLEVLFHLARSVGRVDPSMASELSQTHSALAGQPGSQPLHESARAAVLDAADRLNRRLVLMIENLHALLAGGEQDLGWQLRETLQSEPQIALVASATSRFEAVHETDQPFFELFRTVHLAPLNAEECRRLWEAASGESAREQDIRPLQILTGGNPRLLVICAGFAKHRSLRQLMEELVTLIDENTEYFRGHLELLPRSERRVFISVLDLWCPSSATAIAARARMDVRAVSTMLARLIDRGAVTANPAGTSSRKLYSASEPLFSIYYKMRRERDEAAIVENLIAFMLAFYQTGQFAELLQEILPDAPDRPWVIDGIDRALRRDHEQAEVFSEKITILRDASQSAKRKRQADVERELIEGIMKALLGADFGRVVERAEAFEAAGHLGFSSRPNEVELFLAWAKSESWLRLAEPKKVVDIGRRLAVKFGDSTEDLIVDGLAGVQALSVKALFNLERFDEVRAAARKYIEKFRRRSGGQSEEQLASVRLCLAKAESRQGNTTACSVMLAKIIQEYGDSHSIHVQRVVAEARIESAGSLADAQPTLAELNAVIDFIEDPRSPKDRSLKAHALLLRGLTLGAQGSGETELNSYEGAIGCVQGSDEDQHRMVLVIAMFYKGLYEADALNSGALSNTHVQLRAEIESCSGQTKRLAEWFEKCLHCLSMAHQGNRLATDAFRLVCAAPISNARLWIQIVIRVVANLLRNSVQPEAILATLESDPEVSKRMLPLIVALRLFMGEPVIESAEILEIAQDVQTKLQVQAPHP